MSASLVGSEMCIRDRFCALRCFGVRCSGRSASRGVQNGTLRRMMSAQSVSYTHLTLPTICSV
eukprot:10608845-Alexandrium_andersonii.AAC.1